MSVSHYVLLLKSAVFTLSYFSAVGYEKINLLSLETISGEWLSILRWNSANLADMIWFSSCKWSLQAHNTQSAFCDVDGKISQVLGQKYQLQKSVFQMTCRKKIRQSVG